MKKKISSGGVESTDYAMREYGASATDLISFGRRTHGKIEKARKTGKLHKFSGDIETLVSRKGH